MLHELAASRAKSVPERVMAGAQPEVWVAEQVREVQYALDAGDTIFAPATPAFQRRAVHLGHKCQRVKDNTMQRYRRGC